VEMKIKKEVSELVAKDPVVALHNKKRTVIDALVSALEDALQQ